MILATGIRIICILLLHLSDFINCLKLLEIKVPKYVTKNDTVQLKCVYDLEGEALYSVKWYKDGNEFYRYMPIGNAIVETFPLPGVDVDLHTSHEANITLNDVNFDSSGRFRCEISGEAPSFQTVTDFANMEFAVLPKQGNPRIEGARPRYQLGDWAEINCTSGLSKPAVELTWLINNIPAKKLNLRTFPTLTTDKLQKSTLGLYLQMNKHLFENGDLRLKCVANLSDIYWRSDEEIIEVDRPQKAHVQDSYFHDINSGADPVLGTSTLESLGTKLMSTISNANRTDTNGYSYVPYLCLTLLVAGSSIMELISQIVRKFILIRECEPRNFSNDKCNIKCVSHFQANRHVLQKNSKSVACTAVSGNANQIT